jgi:plastocyanin
MSTIPILNAVRIIPRDEEFLNRKLGSRGEIFYDRDSNSLRLYDGQLAGGISLAKADLTNIPNSVFLAKATAAGVSGGGSAPNSFATIVVAGQSNVVADSATDTLTLVAGNNITISTNADTDTVTISGIGGLGGASALDDLTDVVITGTPINGQVLKYNGTNWINDTDATSEGGEASNSFSTISVSGQNNVVADSSSDTLTFAAGTGISIITNADTDTVTITNTASAGVTAFTGLSDRADLTVDKFYLPAITMLTVTNSGASAYRFDQYGSTNNPTVYAINGTTIAFNLAASGHPFLIQTPSGVNYNTGLTHVTPAGVVTTGASAQGKDSGTLYWKVPIDISGGYRYQCSLHGSMVGSITIKNFATL